MDPLNPRYFVDVLAQDANAAVVAWPKVPPSQTPPPFNQPDTGGNAVPLTGGADDHPERSPRPRLHQRARCARGGQRREPRRGPGQSGRSRSSSRGRALRAAEGPLRDPGRAGRGRPVRPDRHRNPAQRARLLARVRGRCTTRGSWCRPPRARTTSPCRRRPRRRHLRAHGRHARRPQGAGRRGRCGRTARSASSGR